MITHSAKGIRQQKGGGRRGWQNFGKKGGSKHLGRVFIKYKIGVRSPPPTMYVTLSRYASIPVSVSHVYCQVSVLRLLTLPVPIPDKEKKLS